MLEGRIWSGPCLKINLMRATKLDIETPNEQSGSSGQRRLYVVKPSWTKLALI
jgi:hypothetical protein